MAQIILADLVTEDLLWGDRPTIIYDGECPFCSTYVRLHRLRETIGAVRLVDARSLPGDTLDHLKQHFDLDEGMIFALNGRIHHGADAVHALALLSSERGWFNRLNASVFQTRLLSRTLYPLLRFGRTVAITLKGVGRIHRRA